MKYNTLVELIVKMPIFDSMSIRMFEGEKNNNHSLSNDAKSLLNSLFQTKRIELPCVECNANYPFDVSYTIDNDNQAGSYIKHNGIMCNYYNIDSKEILNASSLTLPDNDEGIIYYTFRCTMSNTHYQKLMLLYTVKNEILVLRKIGQKPLNNDLRRTFSNDYKRILLKYNSFDDFRNFEQSESRNLLAGSCTYLRRIFEKMINQMLQDEHISEEDRNKAIHIEDKIALVKNQFDPDLVESLKNSYSLLSKGIHELDNNEIMEFYSLMFDFIVNQLEYEKEVEEKTAKKRELKANIDSMVNKYK